MRISQFDTVVRESFGAVDRRSLIVVLASLLASTAAIDHGRAKAGGGKGKKKPDKQCAKDEKQCGTETATYCVIHFDFVTAAECANAFRDCCEAYGKCNTQGANSCVERTRHAWTPCSTPHDCDGDVCVNGRCGGTIRPCQANADCPPGWYCEYVGGSTTLSCYNPNA